MNRLAAVLIATACTGCLSAWDLGGPWACGDNDACPGGYTCDDGLCCIPGSSPACPTLPLPGGGCPDGGAVVLFQDLDGDQDGNEKSGRVFCAPPVRGHWVRTGLDCDDTDPAINSSATEQCNGKDDNCNRELDEGLTPRTTFFPDEDGDGYGPTERGVMACVSPAGFVEKGGDCAPFDPTKYPAAAEQCNGLDDDCDGVADAQETSFVDVDDGVSARFPCLTGAPGVCTEGTFRCVREGGVKRVCTSRQSPQLEVCDGLDNNCDGATDEQPACGGPQSLLPRDAVFRAARLSSGATLSTSCQARRTEAVPVSELSSDGRTWGSGDAGSGFYVWSAEAPGTSTWDLSSAGAVFHLPFEARAWGASTTRGAWGSLDAGDSKNPVLYLCGERDDEYIRYVPSEALAFRRDARSFSQTIPLEGSNDWVIGLGSGFGTSKVRRVELVFFTTARDFEMVFAPDAGAFGFDR